MRPFLTDFREQIAINVGELRRIDLPPTDDFYLVLGKKFGLSLIGSVMAVVSG